MVNINIVCVGKIKEKFYTQACEEYIKRLSKFCKLNIIELSDEKTKDGASDVENEKVKDIEGRRILEKLPDKALVITLEINGNMLDSEKLADYLSDNMLRGKSAIYFVIGGSLGLSSLVTKRADYHLSFSKMTFPHQLMRVILLEQIYRSFKIMSGEPYHK